MPWDTVPSAPHDLLNRVQPYVGALREKSARRIAGDPQFGFLTDDIARLRKSLATKSISLNEAERRVELAESKARQKEREREHRILRATRPTRYEITLENVSSPGLPRPVAFDSHADSASSSVPSAAAGEQEGEASPRPPSADDIIVNEAEKVLADYVGLLTRQTAPAGCHTTGIRAAAVRTGSIARRMTKEGNANRARRRQSGESVLRDESQGS